MQNYVELLTLLKDNNELFVDDVFECLSVWNGAGWLGSCDTECILDDDVLDDNAGMML